MAEHPVGALAAVQIRAITLSRQGHVITSYSIHYTKLYELGDYSGGGFTGGGDLFLEGDVRPGFFV